MKFLLLILLSTVRRDTLPPTAHRDTLPPQQSPARRDTLPPQQLKEIVVKGQKPVVRQPMEGIVINPESSVLTKGSSILDVLERSPGVFFNRRNNEIELNGKAGVMVMLDGRLLRMTMAQVISLLQGMSADDIEKIELLTTPSARYDAEGSAGLINIVLKRDKKYGTNGSISLTGGYGWREKGTASLNFSHNTKKINLYGSYTISHNPTYSELFITGSQNMPFLGGPTDVRYWDTSKIVQNDQNALLGLDLNINPTTTLGASITYDHTHTVSGTGTYAGYNVLPDSLLLYNGGVKGVNRWDNWVSSLYWGKTIGKSGKLNIGLDYLLFINNNPSTIQSSFTNKAGQQAVTDNAVDAPSQRSFASTAIKTGVFKIDYTKQVTEKWKWEAGLKGSLTGDTSHSGIASLTNGAWITDTGVAADITMKEFIGAGYASGAAKLTASTNLVIGLRYEYSTTRMTDPATGATLVNRRLGVLFPDIFLSGKWKEKSDWQFSLTKRISRPDYNDLASFISYSDPTAVYTGNPFLQPTITTNIKLGYTYSGRSFSLLFSRDNDPILRYQLTYGPAANLLYISPQNAVYQDNLTVQANLPWKVNGWWTSSVNLVGGWRQAKLDYTLQPVTKSWYAWSVNFSESFKLPGNYAAELSGWYNSLSYNGTQTAGANAVLNAGFKKELGNNKGTFQLSLSDLLRTMRYDIHYGTFTEEPFAIQSHVRIKTESAAFFPIVKLTYTRSFGSASPASARRHDEDGRIRK